MATSILVDSPKPLLTKCESCIVAKFSRKPYPLFLHPPTLHMLDLVHSDLCSPFPVCTPYGKLYFAFFLNNHTNFINVQLLSSKEHALEAWNIVKVWWENHMEQHVKVFCSDNGEEFISNTFTKALQDTGIEHQLSASYTHQQNGKAEHVIWTLQGHTTAMLNVAKLSSSLWGEAILMAAYLWNCTKSVTLPPGVTPFEMVNRCKSNLSHNRVFGSRCWAHIPMELQTKLGPHTCWGIFMGYPEGVKDYYVWNAISQGFFITRDIKFNEGIPGISSSTNSDSKDDESTPSSLIVPIETQHDTNIPASNAPRQSTCTWKLTEKEAAWAAEMAATHAHLQLL